MRALCAASVAQRWLPPGFRSRRSTGTLMCGHGREFHRDAICLACDEMGRIGGIVHDFLPLIIVDGSVPVEYYYHYPWEDT